MAEQRFRFTKELRVRRQSEFDRVYRRNVYSADNTLVVQGCENGLKQSRLGLSVSRRVGNAVVRNRWKRLIREAFRVGRCRFPGGLDLVVRPRRGAMLLQADVARSLPKLVRRIHRQLLEHGR